ncbi:MAG: class I SAM-dependent methyltransferase [Chloroflexota bacterium]
MTSNDDTNALLQKILTRLDDLERGQELLYEQLEALLNLLTMLGALNAPMPPMRKWSIAPDFGLLLYSLLNEYQPANVLELGGGVSTLITGYFFSQIETEGKITAIDHHPFFAEQARKQIELHQMIDVATVIHAPLTDVTIHDTTYQWYDPTEFDLIHSIDFLTIDGPPQQDNPQPMVRYPAMPILFHRLNSGAIILMDDTHRQDETQIVQRWLDEFDVVKLGEVDNEKGAIILQKR